mmetsp:Transcript_35435/g.69368  ORF Transcript_35435/g.69368 Transcript_35435/m.69368 type:complete len:124 (+) Transcript_35435:66-437(+)|eukprot:CAMPEP_0173407440 /NCGR_PEP_ID=MMETSP1356-20130122/67119_1 /TAXON_ID=77927 ORGANISM="Hemiselmis virescens, Strain PCC157" /NCGR_SAMPLE_ID=MMETSP1356 /ASSEMBLY_ACC=CAM_ASM_000847 /LENGTH=123 /DNA_ID=CAMNT_0014368619 /DNA_START=63 /DNA_END=434 /DNA_ORIENTATION=-
MGVFNKECLDIIAEKRKKLGNPKLSWSEVSQKNSAKKCYIVIEGCAFNVTDYMTRHPGGQAAILRHGGKNATAAFNKVGSHTSSAKKALANLYIADVGSSIMPSFGSSKGKKGASSACSCVLS